MKKYTTKLPNVKTTISINEDLYERADALARELEVTRSGLYAIAVRELILRHESKSMLEKLNDAYRDSDPEDELLVEGIKRHGRRLLNDEER